tara:strand:- start:628 stop:1239 length:612 start_codon:yes stop_codon:yes gene_type:complete
MRVEPSLTRRLASAALAAAALQPMPLLQPASAGSTVKMEGLRGQGKATTLYPDFEQASSGLQFKDYKQGTGASPATGDRVLIDWTGVTVGYQGRYFEARNKPKGGAFEGDGFDVVLSFNVGDGTVIPGVDEAVRGMQTGGIRRIIVPTELSYPKDGFATVGPKPSTFSGQRALDFVLSSKDDLMDKTLMFDLKLVSFTPSASR